MYYLFETMNNENNNQNLMEFPNWWIPIPKWHAHQWCCATAWILFTLIVLGSLILAQRCCTPDPNPNTPEAYRSIIELVQLFTLPIWVYSFLSVLAWAFLDAHLFAPHIRTVPPAAAARSNASWIHVSIF